MKTILVDANIIIRFLLNDHPTLSFQAKDIILKAQQGSLKLYLDEVVIAEIIWTLSSFYRIKRFEISDKLEEIVSQNWVINPKKDLIIQTLALFRSSNLDYIDCWLFVVGKSLDIELATFDKALKKLK